MFICLRCSTCLSRFSLLRRGRSRSKRLHTRQAQHRSRSTRRPGSDRQGDSASLPWIGRVRHCPRPAREGGVSRISTPHPPPHTHAFVRLPRLRMCRTSGPAGDWPCATACASTVHFARCRARAQVGHHVTKGEQLFNLAHFLFVVSFFRPAANAGGGTGVPLIETKRQHRHRLQKGLGLGLRRRISSSR